jgi:CRP-like cAMP-binding protein
MDQAAALDCPPGFESFVAKLELGGPLSRDEREALRVICENRRHIPAHRDIISDGDRPDHVHVLLEGWAARYKILPDGGRQITAFLVPGDYCDAHVAVLRRMDHGIMALTDTVVGFVPHAEFDALPLKSPTLARALWWATLVDEAVLRAWIVNLGRRDAYGGVAHLLCELHARLRNVGLVEDGAFDLPLTQEVIADALGLTSVHTNRVLQRLRSEDLILLQGGVLTILDAPGLQRAAGFDSAYLHVRPRGD